VFYRSGWIRKNSGTGTEEMTSTKFMRLIFAAILTGWAWAPTSGAQNIITLEQCLQKTLDYSRDILIADESRNISKGRYLEERSAALPQLRAETAAIRTRNDSLRGVAGIAPEKNEYHANLNLTQALFTWGQIGAAIKAARYDRESTEHQLREARQLALREAATSFFDLLLTYELEKVARDNVGQKRRHLEETERRHQMEVVTDYDVLAAQVALTNAQPTLTQAENEIRLAKDRVRYFMGIQEEFEVTGTLSHKMEPAEALPSVLESARENRPEVAFFESRVGVFKELITVARGGNKPRLDFRANLGWTAHEEINNDFPGQHWDAGFYLSMPIFDGFLTKGRVVQAKSQRAITELEMKKLLDNIALEARGAINRVNEAMEIVKGLEATVSEAERLLEMAEAGYRHWVKTRLEVDDAIFNLTSSRVNLVRARRDYLTARTRLMWIKGEDLQSAIPRLENASVSR
jgi:outer membrane protein